jgi:hypothetical protein
VGIYIDSDRLLLVLGPRGRSTRMFYGVDHPATDSSGEKA